jgi:dimethylargininase
VSAIETAVRRFRPSVEKIKAPGTVEAGDIMMVGDHYYIGLSARTNKDGAAQAENILNQYGMTSETIKLEEVLHLKTGLAYLENNNLIVSGEFLAMPGFDKFNKIEIPARESYAANCLWINGTVLIPSGYPVTKQLLSRMGYPTIVLEMTEFQKLDGGLSCLSLRF